MNNLKSEKEHLLEQIWVLKEKDVVDFEKNLIDTTKISVMKLAEELEEEGYVKIVGDKITLTTIGNDHSKNIIRRLRLAEVLMSEILEVDNKVGMSQACEFEHVLTPEVTDSMCTFLGHPQKCPHGLDIPRGECCDTFKTEVEQFVKPLVDLKIGEFGKIVFMSPKSHTRLDKLMAFGINPGSEIKLHQKSPSIVLQIGETDLALDYDIAKNIYVKSVNKEK